MFPEKCATPIISFSKGKLTFTCETEGVEFVYNIKVDNVTLSNGNEIPLPSTYHISVYAIKECYENSDVTTADINVKGLKGDVNGDGSVTIVDAVTVVDIILGNDSSE